jgi:hypothetical protein
MISLRVVLSGEYVRLNRPYLARVDRDEYRVVYPTCNYIKGIQAPYRSCEFSCVSGEVFRWDALRELAEII